MKLVFTLLLIISSFCVNAITISGNDSLTVSDSSYTLFDSFDNSTVSIITGGAVAFYRGYDQSYVSISGGGHVSHMNLYNDSTASVFNGDISHYHGHDSSNITLYDEANISHLNIRGNSNALIFGGEYSFINFFDSSTAIIHELIINGGSFLGAGVSVNGGALTFEEGASIDIYANGVSFVDGMLYGVWANSLPFNFWVIGRTVDINNNVSFYLPDVLPGQINIHSVTVVPLPATVWLLGSVLLGFIGFSKKRIS